MIAIVQTAVAGHEHINWEQLFGTILSIFGILGLLVRAMRGPVTRAFHRTVKDAMTEVVGKQQNGKATTEIIAEISRKVDNVLDEQARVARVLQENKLG
jgi:hypothetical protein